jgi:hypothetical protein
MKRLILLLTVLGCLMMLSSCSDKPVDVNTHAGMTLVPRPEFVDDRPPDVISQFVLEAPADLERLDKKPPPEPPDDPEDPNPNPAHKYAYIVGISDYEGTVNDLQYCDDDAQDIRSYLQSQGFTIQVDLNRNATADNITAGLQWLVNQAEPGDEIAFFYSGHGAKAPGYGSCIISTDLYYVTHGYVMSYFNAVDCSKKLCLLDACVIGDFHSDSENGTVMATASNRKDSYDAPDLHNGAWTYHYVEAAADLDMIFAEDCAVYAEDGMEAWAAQYHLRVDPKHSDKYSGMFDM